MNTTMTKKLFEYSIDTTTPCKFLTNRNKTVFDFVSTTLNHTCFRGVLILKVVSIETISMARVVHSNPSAICTLNIIFIAEVLYLVENDIVDLVKIVIEDGHMYGKHEYVTISFMRSNTLRPLKKDQVIPVKLGDMQRYNMCNSTISSNGTLLICDITFDLYHIKGTMSDEEREILNKMMESIHTMMVKIDYKNSKLNNTIVDKISADPSLINTEILLYLLYSHTKYEIPQDTVPLESLIGNKGEFDVVIFKDTRIPRETTLIQSKPRGDIKNVEPILVTPFKGLYSLISMTLNIVRNIKVMEEFYKATAPMEYTNMFSIWMASKLS